jgi:hypothetical protein
MLCRSCRNALSRPREAWDSGRASHYIYGGRTVEDLAASARGDCRICRLFWETVPMKDLKLLLNRRGWVIQERLLSPRTIHFSSQFVLGM